MNTFQDIINGWPSLADFASDIGVEENTAKQMRTRNSVNPVHWPSMIDGAKRRKIVGVTFEALTSAYAAKRSAGVAAE